MAVLAAAALFACTDTSEAPTALQAPASAHRSISPGDNLRQITGAYSQNGCSVNTGIAFDGTNLILSCWYYPVLDIVSPADGHLISSVNVSGYSGFGALAYDGAQHKLWACESGAERVVLIDLATGVGETKFPSQGCIDGLAYDGSDQTIWASPDVSSTVYHYQQDGTLIGSFPVGGSLGGFGNSGIAVGGDKLYLANNGGSTIYEAAKDFSSVSVFATFPARLEDMECDDVTFAADGVGAIWSIDAYDRTLNAWAIPAGACKFGGGGPEPCTTPPTTTLAALPGSLWSPNHKYVAITVTPSATPGCADDAIASTSGFVVSSEPDEETPVGDGHTSGDIRVTHSDGTVTLSSNAMPSVPFNAMTDRLEVRAERQGTAAPRVYTISFTATGGSGLSSTSTATVVVNHNP
jgi:hypothetical protein